MNTAHFLLTRFNIPIGNVPTDLNLNDDWLEHRFALFENFCLPSVLAQENKDFCWLIWMDERTPERWRSRLKTGLLPLSSHLLQVKPGPPPIWSDEIAKLANATSAQRVVTTRMDSDDAISRDYLAQIRQCAESLRNDRPHVINFRNGCQVSAIGFFAVSENLNPFLSVVSPRQPLVTAWHGEHAGMNRFGKVLEKGKHSQRPLYWLQSIHGNNVANRLQQKGARIAAGQLACFALGEHWMQLLQNENFSVADAEVSLVRFSCPRPWISPAQDRARDVALSGFQGEYLLENVRREAAFYQSDLLQFLDLLTRGAKPGLMIDVGANIGNHTVFFAKVLAAHVLSIEPNPVALKLLKSNVELNAIAGRVTIVEAAAWDAPGSAQLHTTSLLNLGASKIVEKPGNITLKPLDEILAPMPLADKVSLIKVAVEGFENRVLRGALQTIRNSRPILVVEAPTAEALREIETTLAPFRYARTGPFGETSAYVFAPQRWRLWRSLLLRRVFRTTKRLRRKLCKT
jgi:FkbM family methyltransferase